MRSRAIVVLGIVLCAGACGGSAQRQQERSEERPAGARAVSPFIAQFAGEYYGSGAIEVLSIQRNGAYSAKISGLAEGGVYDADFEKKELPIELRLSGGSKPWRVVIDGYRGALRVADGKESWTLQRRVLGFDEELCDQSQGLWLDDDADPATGLFCLCGEGTVFIPSEGGCVP